MKKLINSLLFVLILSAVSACKSDLDSEIDGNHRSEKAKKEQILKTIRMSFGGDFITETEEPLLRAEDGDTYTAINVWRTEKKDDGTKGKEERYAYGLFKRKDNINIDVVTGFTYRFEATILIEKDDKLKIDNNDIAEPFGTNNIKDNRSEPTPYSKTDLNKFIYTEYYIDNNQQIQRPDNEREYFCGLKNGTSYVKLGSDHDNDSGEYKYPRVKRYYGNLAIFDPEISDIVDIPMLYKSFGLKIVVEELPSGNITIEDVTEDRKEAQEYLTFPIGLTLQKTNEWEGLYSMNNLLASSETFNLNITWNKGGGVTESFPANVTISPKTKKVLKVKITGTPNIETKGNVTFNIESDELTLDEQEVSHDFN